MIFESQVPKECIIVFDTGAKLLRTRLVLVHLIARNEALVQLDNLAQSQVLPGRSVEAAGGLDELWTSTSARRWSRREEGFTINVS